MKSFNRFDCSQNQCCSVALASNQEQWKQDECVSREQPVNLHLYELQKTAILLSWKTAVKDYSDGQFSYLLCGQDSDWDEVNPIYEFL